MIDSAFIEELVTTLRRGTVSWTMRGLDEIIEEQLLEHKRVVLRVQSVSAQVQRWCAIGGEGKAGFKLPFSHTLGSVFGFAHRAQHIVLDFARGAYRMSLEHAAQLSKMVPSLLPGAPSHAWPALTAEGASQWVGGLVLWAKAAAASSPLDPSLFFERRHISSRQNVPLLTAALLCIQGEAGRPGDRPGSSTGR